MSLMQMLLDGITRGMLNEGPGDGCTSFVDNLGIGELNEENLHQQELCSGLDSEDIENWIESIHRAGAKPLGMSGKELLDQPTGLPNGSVKQAYLDETIVRQHPFFASSMDGCHLEDALQTSTSLALPMVRQSSPESEQERSTCVTSRRPRQVVQCNFNPLLDSVFSQTSQRVGECSSSGHSAEKLQSSQRNRLQGTASSSATSYDKAASTVDLTSEQSRERDQGVFPSNTDVAAVTSLSESAESQNAGEIHQRRLPYRTYVSPFLHTALSKADADPSKSWQKHATKSGSVNERRRSFSGKAEARKKKNCHREKVRQENMNRAYAKLKKALPWRRMKFEPYLLPGPHQRKNEGPTKLKILRCTIEYIEQLAKELKSDKKPASLAQLSLEDVANF